jgi:hypothetical protein
MIFSTANVSATPPRIDPTPTPAPKPPSHVATLAELQTAQQLWARSRHANTYDAGQGANSTCASCKSPRNWDPDAPAAEFAHDCALCKREPGKPQPPLPGGVAIAQPEWKNITCDVCHQPVGNSYSTALSYWNQETQKYEPIKSTIELCGKCHIGQHGFDVIREQSVSPAHKDWDCTRCHGSHNAPVQCTDCHNIAQVRGVAAHAQHPNVGCTACHDAGGLPIWQDPFSTSRFYQKYMPMRSAHDLRSWPSHDLQITVDCRRCHHPQGPLQITVASQVRCDNQACHSEGASFDWCPQFPRGSAPKVTAP